MGTIFSNGLFLSYNYVSLPFEGKTQRDRREQQKLFFPSLVRNLKILKDVKKCN
jgi:hypothetical protein